MDSVDGGRGEREAPAIEEGAPALIPFIDLKVQNEALRSEIEAGLGRVLDQGAFALGPEVAAFEERFAELCEVPHAIAVASGTAALHLSLAALEIGPGDEVIVPPFTFIATASVVRYLGATPVFADIEPDTYCIDPGRRGSRARRADPRDRPGPPLRPAR